MPQIEPWDCADACHKPLSGMAYGTDLEASARRHLRAAIELSAAASPGAQPGCQAVAGYLYGLAGELAVKAMMLQSGMRPEGSTQDPFFAHFPRLKEQLKDAAEGRRQGELLAIAGDRSLFQNWDTKMRYAATREINAAWVSSWKVSAEKLVMQMDY